MATIEYHVPIKTKLPKNLHTLPEKLQQDIMHLHINPPWQRKSIDEDEIITALRQNGWSYKKRKIKGKFRLYLSKELSDG